MAKKRRWKLLPKGESVDKARLLQRCRAEFQAVHRQPWRAAIVPLLLRDEAVTDARMASGRIFAAFRREAMRAETLLRETVLADATEADNALFGELFQIVEALRRLHVLDTPPPWKADRRVRVAHTRLAMNIEEAFGPTTRRAAAVISLLVGNWPSVPARATEGEVLDREGERMWKALQRCRRLRER